MKFRRTIIVGNIYKTKAWGLVKVIMQHDVIKTYYYCEAVPHGVRDYFHKTKLNEI